MTTATLTKPTTTRPERPVRKVGMVKETHQGEPVGELHRSGPYTWVQLLLPF